MSRSRGGPAALSALLIVALALVVGVLFLRRPAPPSGASTCPPREAPCARAAPPAQVAAARPEPAALRLIAIGAVESPEQNQVQIEQDLELARVVFGERSGLVLYAGGAGSRDVQVEARQSRGDRLLGELAALFAPRGGRASRYRAGRLPRHGPASLPALEDAIRSALARPGPPLTLFLAGHGERGERHAQNHVALWGGRRLDAERLAGFLDGARRPVRLVVTSCYGGGFAEALFLGADPARGAGRDRCGFFATTADLPATGCDPNPDRPDQEGYALHFLNALRGRDRDGRALPRAELDLDGDGAISFAEAHARARIALGSIDVPTSTSERWLRFATGSEQRSKARPGARAEPDAPFPAPEELAVTRALATRTGLPADLRFVRRLLREREEKIDEAYGVYDDASRAEDDAARRAIAELLARWPVLDDPYHPEFAETVRCERAAIAAHLRTSRAYEDYLDAVQATDAAEAEHFELRRRAAPVERLLRALENLSLARRLQARGGEPWARYRAILACERTGP